MLKARLSYQFGTDNFDLHIKLNDRIGVPVIVDVLAAIADKMPPRDASSFERHGPIYNPPDCGHEIAQAFLDAAWEQGLRPTGFADVKNETAALKGHLADMRALAFGALKIGEPK